MLADLERKREVRKPAAVLPLSLLGWFKHQILDQFKVSFVLVGVTLKEDTGNAVQ